MLHSELRDKFLNFFHKREHRKSPSSSLVPKNDDSTLFTSAGMQPLVPILSGKEPFSVKRMANSQKCLRTNDIDQVGDDTHLTFFEMLGSWSFGDYGKEDAIQFAHDFMTTEEGLNIPREQLWVTVFEGAEGIPRDDEAAAIWQKIGMPEERIIYLGMEDNWWSAGPTGLCGPDTEIFFDTKYPEPVPEGQHPGNDPDGRFVEIWNSVFMAYDRKEDQTLEELPHMNVDQGAGLERMLAVYNGQSIYETDCFREVYGILSNSITTPTDDTQRSLRIISDHMRSVLFVLSENPQIYPSANKHGSVLRHLIREAVMHANDLGIDPTILEHTLDVYADIYGDQYGEVRENLEAKKAIFKNERQKLEKTLARLPGLVEKFIDASIPVVSGEAAHAFVSTHGGTVELLQRELGQRQQVIDMAGYRIAAARHSEISKAKGQKAANEDNPRGHSGGAFPKVVNE